MNRVLQAARLPASWPAARAWSDCSPGAGCGRSHGWSTTSWACTARWRCPRPPPDWAHTARLHQRRLDRRGRLDRPARTRAGGNRAARAATSRCATRWPRRCWHSPTPRPAHTRSSRCGRREEVLHGAYLDRAPDLLLEAAPLYSLTHARSMVEPADWLSGDHRPEGVYVATESSLDHRPRRGDLAAGLRWHHPGRKPAWNPSLRLSREAAGIAVYSDEEQAEVEQRLRELGYLE